MKSFMFENGEAHINENNRVVKEQLFLIKCNNWLGIK